MATCPANAGSVAPLIVTLWPAASRTALAGADPSAGLETKLAAGAVAAAARSTSDGRVTRCPQRRQPHARRGARDERDADAAATAAAGDEPGHVVGVDPRDGSAVVDLDACDAGAACVGAKVEHELVAGPEAPDHGRPRDGHGRRRTVEPRRLDAHGPAAAQHAQPERAADGQAPAAPEDMPAQARGGAPAPDLWVGGGNAQRVRVSAARRVAGLHARDRHAAGHAGPREARRADARIRVSTNQSWRAVRRRSSVGCGRSSGRIVSRARPGGASSTGASPRTARGYAPRSPVPKPMMSRRSPYSKTLRGRSAQAGRAERPRAPRWVRARGGARARGRARAPCAGCRSNPCRRSARDRHSRSSGAPGVTGRRRSGSRPPNRIPRACAWRNTFRGRGLPQVALDGVAPARAEQRGDLTLDAQPAVGDLAHPRREAAERPLQPAPRGRLALRELDREQHDPQRRARLHERAVGRGRDGFAGRRDGDQREGGDEQRCPQHRERG